MQSTTEQNDVLFSQPVGELASSPVRTITEAERASVAAAELEKLGISALPVVDRSGRLVGVVSRTDLLRIGRVRRVDGWRRQVLNLPDTPVRDVMSSSVEVMSPAKAVRDIARRMVQNKIHRLYIAEDRVPTGVVSTKEMMRAVAEARIARPVSELMHRSLIIVNADAPVSLAIDRMAVTHHSGLVVVEDGWPVGFFTQADALAARQAPPDERVDHWLDPRLICVPLAMPLFRAAEQAIATRARRLLVIDGEGMKGMLTGLDFARFVQG